MKRVHILLALLCAAITACSTKEKPADVKMDDEPQKPQDGTTFFGTYAYDDGSQLTDRFFSFSNGNIYEYHLQGETKVVLAENALWHTSLDDFTVTKNGAYQIVDGDLYINGALYGSLHVASDRIVISDKTYVKFRDFNAAWYTTLSVEAGDTLKYTYRKQDVSVPVRLSKSVPGSALSASVVSGNAWITDCSIDSGNLVFEILDNNTVASRKGGIQVACPGAEDLSLTVIQFAATVQSLSLNKESLDMLVGENYNLIATVFPEDASLEWSSNETSVATVTQAGQVTATGIGTATITVSAQGGQKTASCEVTVKDTPSFSISRTSLAMLPDGGSESITIISNSDCQFTATSSDQSVASVSVSGKTVSVIPHSIGETTITVNCPETQSYVSVSSLTCKVRVIDMTDYNSAEDISSTPANCYVISHLGLYKFNPVKGNSSTSVGVVASAEVLWESFGTATTPSVGDIISEALYINNYVYFVIPSTFKNGNAVIAAKDASGNILWSWHIWVCKDYNPEATAQTYYNDAGVMMDRNLGATSATPGDAGALGLLYQWGRKDPFLGSSSISSNTKAASTITWPSAVESNSSNGTIDYAVKHPTTFITYNSNNYDWYYTGSSSTDNTRWSSTKGMYDPCPPGWRVPDGGKNGVWSKAIDSSSAFSYTWDSTNKGMNFNGKFCSSTTIWYPAVGCLNLPNGNLPNVGNSGLWWSCTPSGNPTYILGLDIDGSVFPSAVSKRAYGYSVRCLQE